MATPTLILASASPRRKDLLRESGYSFRAVPAEIEEVTPEHLTVSETVLLNAKRKTDAVARNHPDSVVVGVDTVVSLQDNIFGKPGTRARARAMLLRLSGREHEVYSGVWIRNGTGTAPVGFVEMSRVRFRALTEAELERYLESVETLDKAGGYAAQEDPMGIIAEIEGSRTNVIGLPMERLGSALRIVLGDD